MRIVRRSICFVKRRRGRSRWNVRVLLPITIERFRASGMSTPTQADSDKADRSQRDRSGFRNAADDGAFQLEREVRSCAGEAARFGDVDDAVVVHIAPVELAQ